MEIEEITTPILIYIEGNIGCGKSTIMQHYNNYKNVDILCEPIELWENFHGSNLLELQYKKQFNFLFQTTVYISRLEQMNKCSKSVRIMERSLYSSFEVFVEQSKTAIPCPMLVLDGNLDKCDWTVQTNKINRTILEIANIKANK